MPNQESKPQTPLSLYTGAPQHENFARMEDFFPTAHMKASTAPFQFPEGALTELPRNYKFCDQIRSTDDFIESTDTSALLVLKDGSVRLEQYFLNGGRDVQWMSFSVGKSFISALIGIAIEEGCIHSIEDPITRYVPALTGSAYDGVRIKDVMQMSSGARWNEDYSDPDAEIHRYSAVMAGEAPFEDFMASTVSERESGSLCLYNSGDTQALGMLIVNATGRTISDYMQEKLCEPLGMESPGYWVLDCNGMEMAAGGVNLTARDFAKIGELFRNQGVWNGKQIVSKPWVSASTTPDAAHLMPGKVVVGDHTFSMGYGYQWWVPAGDRREFSAIGIYNQFVYVDPSRGVVIVKLSANRAYGTSPDEATNREEETLEFLRAIARQFD